MAKANKNPNENRLEEYSNKSSALVYGIENTLDKENLEVDNIINQTIIQSKKKFGIKTNGKPVNYFNEVNIGSTFSELMVSAKNDNIKKEAKKNPDKAFKSFMSEEVVDMSALMMQNSTRTLLLNNYKVIYDHITECAQALDVFKDNIMSPDDFTKTIFNINYDDTTNTELQDLVVNQLKDITKYYDIEDKADKILEDALLYGESYVTALSLENEIDSMLTGDLEILSENLNIIDSNVIDVKILSEDVHSTPKVTSIFNELFNLENKDNETDILIASLINENVKLKSKNEFLLERKLADRDFNEILTNDVDIPSAPTKKTRGRKKKNDGKPMYINGSVVKILDPRKVIDLTVDGKCFGYYYIEEEPSNTINQSYLGQSSGRQITQDINMNSNNTISGNSVNMKTTGQDNFDSEKLRIITDIFVRNISKKIDKDFIRKNKKFKDFIYDLVRQDYITKKGITITYFLPNELVKFEVPALYRKILFSAKLYLSVLTNDILVKLGRAHDKRLIYVNVGLDQSYEQAISNVIKDIKTKEYKMDSLNDFNTILNLNPGRWDDYIMPSINGDRPVEIETMPGMDTDLNSEFLDYLKNTMINGIGIPRNLIDSFSEIDFARTLSAQNGNFVRTVIKYQKLLTDPFTKLYRILYRNQYRFNNDQEYDIENRVNFEAINVSFPSPASLNQSNIADLISTVDGNAEFISSQIITPKQDGSNEEDRVKLKAKIVKDMLPGIDWEKYESYKDELELEKVKEQIKNPPIPQEDMYSNY